MKLRELSKEEFSSFALNHIQNTFHQTVAWAELKATNGWNSYYVGLVDDSDSIVAASLLLSKKLFMGINLFYAPRGFLIDYNDVSTLELFTKLIKDFSKKKKAIFIKLDPYVMYKERDINGDLVEGGIDNSKIVTNLIDLKYIHKGFNVYQGTLQPRWMFVLDIEGKTEEDLLKGVYKATTRHVIMKTLKLGYDIIEVNLDNINEFKDLMGKTGQRRGFIDRPLSYYKSMYEVLSKYNMIKVLLVSFNCDKSIKILTDELNEKLNLKEDIEKKLKESNSKKIATQLKEVTNSIEDSNRKINEIIELKEKNGNNITMAGSMFINYGDEVLYLYSGAYEEFLKYDAPYRLQWEMIKYAVDNGYKRYNFYGISGAFNKEDESYGVYNFKKGFNGKVVELIGEFDLVVNKTLYKLYNFSFKMYHKLKNIKRRLKK